MLRIFLDTNIVNEIADTNGFLELLLQAHQGGAFEIISHDVVKAELEQTADPRTPSIVGRHLGTNSETPRAGARRILWCAAQI